MRAGMVVLLGVLACPACFSSIDLSLLDGQPDAAPPRPDGGRPDGGPRDAGQNNNCLEAMVSAPNGAFCIDSDEVTNEDYEDFLDDDPETGGQPAVCAFNTSFVPGGSWPLGQERKRHPVASVDWCDARAYCAFHGRRLCTENEWFGACSSNGALLFPYGDTYQPVACNGEGSGDAKRVHTAPGCEGGFPGLFDMSGNVAEWIDGCTGTMGANDRCVAFGGSYGKESPELACTTSRAEAARGSSAPTLGFRCCR